MHRTRDLTVRYGVVLVSVLAAFAVRKLLEPLIGESSPFVMLFPAIMLSAWYGGMGPGLAATVACACVADYFFLKPIGEIFINNQAGTNIRLYLFLGEGAFLSWLAGRLHLALQTTRYAEEQLRTLNEDLEYRVSQRTKDAEQRTEQLRRLTFEVTQIERRERRLLAQILHDHLQQLLVAAKMRLDRFRRASADEAELTHVDGLLNECIEAARSLAVELSPPVLYQAGLAAALEWLGRQQLEKYGQPVLVEADRKAEPADEDLRDLLFQVARELVFNAVKHAQASQICVTMRNCDERMMEILVQDNGKGFDIRQLSAPEARQGFGLATIEERLSALGGRLELSSVVGLGTVGRILAMRSAGATSTAAAERPPAAAVKAVPPQDLQTIEEPRRSEVVRVLVVDDHDIVRKGLVQLLRQEPDLQVVGEAANGMTALEMARALRPDVLVTDVTMPGLSGIDVVRHVAMEMPDVHTIGFSMHREHEVISALKNAGAGDFIAKDVAAEELLAAIRKRGTPQEAAH